jgi:hypothetical protein
MAEDENPPETPRNVLARWGRQVWILIILAIGLLVTIWCSRGFLVGGTIWRNHGFLVWGTITVALLLVLVWIAVRFVDLFTGQLSDNCNDEDKARDRLIVERMFRFCYEFMLGALLISFSPALLLWLLYLIGQSLPGNIYYLMVDSPLGLVRGCVHAPKDPEWELACRFPGEIKPELVDPYFAQWLVNIGGLAQYRCSPSSATCPPSDRPISAPSAKPAEAPESGKPKPPELPLQNNPPFWPVTIHGGLAVPWYFLTLAIMGAAVSMARRVPEYQRRVQYGPPSTGQKVSDDAITPSMVREHLVFQVLQVLSAPLIAITAYNAIMPSTRATSVALAFVSGFSSESVLLAIRSLADKIKPEEPKKSTDRAPVA